MQIVYGIPCKLNVVALTSYSYVSIHILILSHLSLLSSKILQGLHFYYYSIVVKISHFKIWSLKSCVRFFQFLFNILWLCLKKLSYKLVDSWKASRIKLKCLVNLAVRIIKWYKSIMWVSRYFFRVDSFFIKKKLKKSHTRF
jgi:hypothetical protein